MVTPIVLKPVTEAGARRYVAEGSISIDPATLEGGRIDNGGCGGAMMNLLTNAAPIELPVSGRIYPNRVVRGFNTVLLTA